PPLMTEFLERNRQWDKQSSGEATTEPNPPTAPTPPMTPVGPGRGERPVGPGRGETKPAGEAGPGSEKKEEPAVAGRYLTLDPDLKRVLDFLERGDTLPSLTIVEEVKTSPIRGRMDEFVKKFVPGSSQGLALAQEARERLKLDGLSIQVL